MNARAIGSLVIVGALPLLAGCRGGAATTESAASPAATPAATSATDPATTAAKTVDAGLDDFEAATIGAPPPGFATVTTIGDPKLRWSPATWSVAEDGDAASGTRVLKLAASTNREAIFNVLLREQPRLADLAISVWIRPDDGFEDRGGGLVWRVKDAQNYYLCRWNPNEKNLRAYAVVAGKRVQLQSVFVGAEAGTWHSIAVTMRGRLLLVSFDGESLIRCTDPTWTEAGRVGIWTKADAKTSFDDFRVEPAKPAEPIGR